MNARHKDFNKYLVRSGIFEGLTDAFVKLFMMSEDDRPENAVWFIQQSLFKELPPDFPTWNEYQTLLRKVDNLKNGRPENEGEEDNADAENTTAHATPAANLNAVPVDVPSDSPAADPNDSPTP